MTLDSPIFEIDVFSVTSLAMAFGVLLLLFLLYVRRARRQIMLVEHFRGALGCRVGVSNREGSIRYLSRIPLPGH